MADLMNPTLRAQIGASAFDVDWQRLNEWKPALDCAAWLALNRNGAELVRVDLSGNRRWVAFQREIGGSQMSVVGYQETVGAVTRENFIIGGSNRKVLAWLHPSGRVTIGDEPEGN